VLTTFVSVIRRLANGLAFVATKFEFTRRHSASGLSVARSWNPFAKSLVAYVPRRREPPPEKHERQGVAFPQPRRPGGMCEEQWTDFKAACERRITWRQYFEKWGKQGLAL